MGHKGSSHIPFLVFCRLGVIGGHFQTLYWTILWVCPRRKRRSIVDVVDRFQNCKQNEQSHKGGDEEEEIKKKFEGRLSTGTRIEKLKEGRQDGKKS